MEQPWICPECSQSITTDDTVVFAGDRLAHLYCRRPRDLTPEEQALFFLYCWGHVAATCEPCAREYRPSELASDLRRGKEHLCPQCHADLLESIRAHLYTCSTHPAEVRRQSQVAREAGRALVKRGRELADRADVLMREAEAALSALRETIRNLESSP
jgi:hypothetical protein